MSTWVESHGIGVQIGTPTYVIGAVRASLTNWTSEHSSAPSYGSADLYSHAENFHNSDASSAGDATIQATTLTKTDMYYDDSFYCTTVTVQDDKEVPPKAYISGITTIKQPCG